MNKEDIIQKIVDKIEAKVYLEIGVEKGINFFTINAPRKIAVDPHFRFGKRHKLKDVKGWFGNSYFEKTSNSFFDEDAQRIFSSRKIDVAFIDGLHTYKQSFIDFQNCVKYLSENGIVILHDCNPLSIEAAEPANSPAEMMIKYPNRKSKHWNGDVWKTIMRIREIGGFDVFVLDCDQGVGVVKRKPNQPALIQSDIEKLTYYDLEQNRDKFLNLKSPDYFNTFLMSLG